MDALQWLTDHGFCFRSSVAHQGSSHLRLDHRSVRPGDIFIALRGKTTDARQFITTAIKRGAAAVLIEDDGQQSIEAIKAQLGSTPGLAIQGLRQQLGSLAHRWYGQPSKLLKTVAITGTSGKTSCTTWVAELCDRLGLPSGVIGTRGAGMINSKSAQVQLEPLNLTTPQVVDLHQWLETLRADGASVVAFEASSVGLEQGRLDQVDLDCAVFTNLSRDHLDYHGDMGSYREAKTKLFRQPGLRTAVINCDDPASAAMLAVARSTDAAVIQVHIDDSDSHNQALRLKLGVHKKEKLLYAQRVRIEGHTTAFWLGGDFGSARVRTILAGRFNISNLLCVAAACLGLGFSLGEIAKQVEALKPVEGRMEVFGGNQAPLVVVDYAHKPDALEKVLVSLREQALARGGQLWCVFGCGGDRDRGKRPLMGEIASRLADRIVVTSDNPRRESPQTIIADILKGIKTPAANKVRIELDRKRAIQLAIQEAAVTDVVVLAGKGHETYQEVGDQKIPFSDAQITRESLGMLT